MDRDYSRMLKEPGNHRQDIRDLFVYFLDLCAGISNPCVTPAASVEKAASQDFPELYDDDAGDANLFLAMRDFLGKIGCHEFAIRDLYTPSKKRLQTQLSAIINFAKYREEKLAFYQELLDPRCTTVAALNEVQEESLALKAQLQDLLRIVQEQQPQLDKVSLDCEEMEEKIRNYNNIQATTRLEADNLGKEAEKLGDALETAKWYLEEESAKEERLRSKIVSSPDRRKSELVLHEGRLSKANNELKMTQERVQQASVDLSNALAAANGLETSNAKLSQLQTTLAGLREWRSRLQTATREADQIQDDISTLQQEVVDAQRALLRAEETKENAAKQNAAREKATAERFESASSQLVQAEDDRHQQSSRVAIAQAAVDRLESENQSEKEDHKQRIKELQDGYDATVAEYVNVVLQQRHEELQQESF